MAGTVADDRAYEAVFPRKRQRGHEVERRAMPDRFKELVRPLQRETGLAVPAVPTVDQDVLLVIAEVARVGEQPAECPGELVLAVRRVGARVGAVAERLGRHVEDDALVADDRPPVDRHVEPQASRPVVREKQQEVHNP